MVNEFDTSAFKVEKWKKKKKKMILLLKIGNFEFKIASFSSFYI